jgi:hypothetical protein
MRKSTARAARSIPVILLIAAAVGWAGSQGGQRVGVIPVFALCGAFCFALNWLVFIHAYAAQTERYFDLTGSLTYLSVVACAVALGSRDPRALLLALLIGAWALRLGTFLFRRIRREGGDRRFDALEPSFPRFLLTWTHTRSASAEQPILLAIERIDSHRDACWRPCSSTIRSARSRTSSRNLLLRPVAPSARSMAPPGMPGRFIPTVDSCHLVSQDRVTTQV